MIPYILYLGLLFSSQFVLAMEMDQNGLDQQLIEAIYSYRKPHTQLTVVDRVEALLNLGANPNILIGQRGESLLLYLLRWANGHENVPIKRRLVELLVGAGADPNFFIVLDEDHPNYPGQIVMPLSCICRIGQLEIFNFLVEHGADVNRCFENNKTLLHEAAGEWNPTLCEYLLKEGLDVNAVTDDNETPLHFACKQNFVRAGGSRYNIPVVIELLLDWGAHVNIQNNMGFAALHSLAHNANWAEAQKVAAGLLSRGADLRILCKREKVLKTPLQLAASMHYYFPNSKKDFKENRRLCEIMVTHQVLVNKGILALLGCLRKMGLERNYIASELYRNREQWLRPYLQKLYLPLNELLQKMNVRSYGKVKLSFEFERFRRWFPDSNFNIDFFDPERIPETYHNLNRNIYRHLQQPRIVSLTQSNLVFNNNNNNNEYQMEEVFDEVLAPIPNDPDSDDDHSDDDNENIWRLIPAQRAAVLDGQSPLPRADAIEERSRVQATQLHVNNSSLFRGIFAVGACGIIGYVVYKYYIHRKNKIDKQKKERCTKEESTTYYRDGINCG